MKKKENKVCICCPYCAAYAGKSILAKSDIICRRCHQLFAIDLSEGVLTVMTSEKTSEKTE